MWAATSGTAEKPELQRTKCFWVGKTTTLSVIREGAEAEGYRVEGLTATTGQRGDVSRSPSEIRRTVKIVKFLTGLRGVATPPLSNQSPKLFKSEPTKPVHEECYILAISPLKKQPPKSNAPIRMFERKYDGVEEQHRTEARPLQAILKASAFSPNTKRGGAGRSGDKPALLQ